MKTLLALLLAGFAFAAAAQPAQLTGSTLHGQPYDLAKSRGKVVLVFAWSTSCAVCLDKMPELRRNVEGWKGKPFELVALNTDRSRTDLDAYLALTERTVPASPQFLHLWRNDANHRDGFGPLPQNVPTSFVIDREGRVVKTFRGRIEAQMWNDIAELVLN